MEDTRVPQAAGTMALRDGHLSAVPVLDDSSASSLAWTRLLTPVYAQKISHLGADGAGALGNLSREQLVADRDSDKTACKTEKQTSHKAEGLAQETAF